MFGPAEVDFLFAAAGRLLQADFELQGEVPPPLRRRPVPAKPKRLPKISSKSPKMEASKPEKPVNPSPRRPSNP
jgi:hypothetical protein